MRLRGRVTVRDKPLDLVLDREPDEFGPEHQVDPADLAEWLVANGYAEDKPGYGHVDGEALVRSLVDRFKMFWRSGPGDY